MGDLKTIKPVTTVAFDDDFCTCQQTYIVSYNEIFLKRNSSP
jgi:hypothetical protein